MEFLGLRRKHAVLVFFAFLAACQGNTGSTPPMTPGAGYTPSSQAASSMREQSVNATATVTLSPDTAQLAFPTVGGFGLTIQLRSPSPTPSPVFSSAPKHMKNGKKKPPTPAPTATPAPTPTPVLSPSPIPGEKKRKGFGKAVLGASGVSQHLVDLTLTVYPDGGPDAPTAAPSVPPVLVRHALVRGDFHAQDPVTLPSLSILSFTLAPREQAPGRAFTVAVFEEHKHRKHTQIAADLNGTADASGKVHVLSSLPAIKLEADHHYAIVLFADDLAPKPAPPTPSGASTAPATGGSPAPSPALSGGPAALQGGTLIR